MIACGDGLDIALAKQQVLVAIDVDFESRLRKEEHPVAILHQSHVGTGQQHICPDASLGGLCGGRWNQQTRSRLALRCTGNDHDEAIARQIDADGSFGNGVKVRGFGHRETSYRGSWCAGIVRAVDAEGLIDWAERMLKDSDAIDHWQKERERIEAEELLAFVLGHDFDLEDDIPLKAQAKFEPLVHRRVTGEPTQLIIGLCEFRGMQLKVGPGVFIPRDSSEFLAQQAIVRLKRRKGGVLVDMACGIGPVALAAAREVPSATVIGSDLSPEQIAMARANARRLGVKVKFVSGDMFASVPKTLLGKVDVISVHPPYVAKKELRELPDEIVKFEPKSVLSDGSADGLFLVQASVAASRSWLRPGGSLLIEVSPDRSKAVMREMRRGGLTDVKSSMDSGFKVTRVLSGKNP